MERDRPLAVTLDRLLETLAQERGPRRSAVLDLEKPATRTSSPEDIGRAPLDGREPPPDAVDERVGTRLKALAAAGLARTCRRMTDLVGGFSRRLGVSASVGRQVCSGDMVPSAA